MSDSLPEPKSYSKQKTDLYPGQTKQVKQQKLSWQHLAIALVGGILIGLTPDPFGWWWLAWIALIPLWLLTQQVGIKSAAILGAIWGFAYHGMALFWITGVHPMDWLGVTWLASLAIAIAVWLFITVWGMAMPILWAIVMAGATQKLSPLRRIIIAAATLCALEWLWGQGPLFWSALGYTQSPHNLLILQMSRLSGQQAVTAAIVVINGLLAEAILPIFQTGIKVRFKYKSKLPTLLLRVRSLESGLRPTLKWHYLRLALFLFLFMALYGAQVMHSPHLTATNGQALQVGIVQGNISNPVKFSPQGTQISLDRYAQGYTQLARSGVEMVVTPEGALPFSYDRGIDGNLGNATLNKLDRAVLTKKVPIWLGAYGRADQPGSHPLDATNSLFLIDRNGAAVSRYNKVKLVPVGEYIPFKNILGGLINRLSPLEGEFVPGKSSQIVESPWGKIIIGICYESAFPTHFRAQAAAGGELIITASNNAHYAETMPAQHHAQDVARAVETDRWAVRATNTGYSGIVDPNGRTIWRSQINTFETHADVVYLRQTKTLYTRLGDWLTPLLVVVGVGIFGWERFKLRRGQ
ncbi:Apolipoprotein N-acyltransferase [Thalassoporum mexicanum PCC 7367]|uniref:apolipoprotein N-acyltransferase n=1 Tax=Thalassoporum mexicanum TaxID=3457544 RepID=UPI00029F9559|nr:apolipoprotein N-acyltransferase [Pseudanabaena sp. PCC 7367]AFY71172.1 Apolipoprotein N-acyltransferase [Pseudanabaena sp. PCC 7367]